MHESHQVQHVIHQAREMMKAKGVAKPRQVVILMGELLGLDDESVRLHWEEMTIGTELEDVPIKVETVAARLKCPKCAKVFEKKGSNLSCPECQVMGTPTEFGKEFKVKELVG